MKLPERLRAQRVAAENAGKAMHEVRALLAAEVIQS